MLHVITPVKDSIELTLQTIRSVVASETSVPIKYTVYNDFSSAENTARLDEASREYGFELVNLADITDHPSPNYLLVLRMAQQRAMVDNAVGLCIVESDVVVKRGTLQGLIDGAERHSQCGIVAAVTIDEEGAINYPYEYAVGHENAEFETTKHCSFCCSLLTANLLRVCDFGTLNPDKNWYDVTISHRAMEAGLHNYLFTSLPVVHRPHSSRPWKQLKYKNPLKYYWLKYTRGLDKI